MKRDETGQGSEFDRLGSRATGADGTASPGQSCHVCDELLSDALDEALSPPEQRWFDAHVSSCTRCAESFADAGRGLAWLALLKTAPPEPAGDLVERILAQTSSAQPSAAQPSAAQPSAAQPSAGSFAPAAMQVAPAALEALAPPARGKLLRFPLRAFALPRFGAGAGFDSRLAMTAAMAFFSIALTLSVTGVRLDQIQTAKLTPRGVQKSFYEADARVVRFYDGLRVVRAVESRLSDLRETQRDGAERDKPADAPQARPNEAPGGVSRRDESGGAVSDRAMSDRLTGAVQGFGRLGGAAGKVLGSPELRAGVGGWEMSV